MHIDLKQMPQLNGSGSAPKRLTFVAALLDEQGCFVTGREGKLTASTQAVSV